VSAISGAEFLMHNEKGHGFPEELWPEFVSRIEVLVMKAENGLKK